MRTRKNQNNWGPVKTSQLSDILETFLKSWSNDQGVENENGPLTEEIKPLP